MKGIILFAAAASMVLSASFAHESSNNPVEPVQGPADAYVYELAAPGTYELPTIKPAADAGLLNEQGSWVSLSEIFSGRVTVLAFIYTRCGDICPMASAYMAGLQSLAAKDPEVAADLRMVSLSFDPEYDIPARMADYAEAFRSDAPYAPPWLFLTAEDASDILPVLAAYDQPVGRKKDAEDTLAPLSHLLRVFLIDGNGMIRNIYSADFLDPRLVLNDIQTLLIEENLHDKGH